MADWEQMPRLLQELCEGHGAYVVEAYQYVTPRGGRLWLCKSCWVDMWFAHGKPQQPAYEGRSEVANMFANTGGTPSEERPDDER